MSLQHHVVGLQAFFSLMQPRLSRRKISFRNHPWASLKTCGSGVPSQQWCRNRSVNEIHPFAPSRSLGEVATLWIPASGAGACSRHRGSQDIGWHRGHVSTETLVLICNVVMLVARETFGPDGLGNLFQS